MILSTRTGVANGEYHLSPGKQNKLTKINNKANEINKRKKASEKQKRVLHWNTPFDSEYRSHNFLVSACHSGLQQQKNTHNSFFERACACCAVLSAVTPKAINCPAAAVRHIVQ